MKTNVSILAVVLLSILCLPASANDGKYAETMKKNIKALYEAHEIDQLQQAINSFERIAAVEKDKWEPLYYIAYGYIMMANFEKDGVKKDGYLDAASAKVAEAQRIASAESELITLEGFISTIRVTVDPKARGPEYAPRAMQAFAKALAISPANPRALALLAQMQFGTARFFNSPTDEACATNEKAMAAFEESVPPTELSPSWGIQMAQSLRSQCK